jgi:alanyl-tRNA synthetase
MHQALRTILGDHVEQKGSMVHSGMFRFDFSHFSKLTDDQVRQVEDFVNSRIKEQLPLDERRNIPFETAISSGAIALFGEKYGDTVRTVRFGKSTELCGGCHVKNTSEIWYFKITSESAVASGIRRIEAITGDAVISYFEEQSQVLNDLKVVMKQQNDPVQGYKSLIEENNSLKKEILVLGKIKIKAIKSNIKKNIVLKNKINFAAHEVDLDAKNLKDLAFEMGDELENLFLVLASKKNNKPLLACFISKNLIKSQNYNASNVVKDLGQYIQGSGGGQEFYATAGGKDINGIEKALKMAISHLK